MKISLVFRVTGLFRRPEEPVTEEKPRNTPSQVRETEAVAQRWCVGAGPPPSWPHPRGLGCEHFTRQLLLSSCLHAISQDISCVLWEWSHVSLERNW